MVKVREDLPTVKSWKQNHLLGLKGEKQYQTEGEGEIDQVLWLHRLANQLHVDALPQLEQACQWVLSKVGGVQVAGRSDAYTTGIGMADILAHLGVEEELLVSAMLFRSFRENLISLDEVQQLFNVEIRDLVEGVAKMGGLSDLIQQKRSERQADHPENAVKVTHEEDLLPHSDLQMSTVYKMLLSVTEDVRVVLIKLAERTFAVRELLTASRERQQRVASEVLTIYAPLAHRLGIAQLKWELEDFAFRFLAPERYKEIALLLSEKRIEREAYIQHVIATLKEALAEKGIYADVTGRVKHIYSIYRKMRSKHLSFDQLYDIRALRVLVENELDCYTALGVVHHLWRHIPHQFDDYLTNPKANGYRSLHTAVIATHKSLEVQIRTEAMHHEAELGVCAHFNYKESMAGGVSRVDHQFNHKLFSLRAVLESYKEGADSGTEHDPEQDQLAHAQSWGDFEKIYVFTRDGDIRELSKNATVLDFAYYVHTEVGNHCYAAKVNQRFVPLNYKLKTGQQVDILTRPDREPSRDWLINSLGYINTVHARDKLRHWLRQQDKTKNLATGLKLFEKELERLAIHPNSIDLADFAERFHVKTGDEILLGLVTGDVSLNALMTEINDLMHLDLPLVETRYRPVVHQSSSDVLREYGLLVDSSGQVEIQHAQCCNPIYDQEIKGMINARRGVVIHSVDCHSFKALADKSPDRVVTAFWEELSSTGQSVKIEVEAYDRRGLLKDVTEEIFKDHINITQVNTQSDTNGIAHLTFMIDVKGLAQLSRLLARLEQQIGVMSARRLASQNITKQQGDFNG